MEKTGGAFLILAQGSAFSKAVAKALPEKTSLSPNNPNLINFSQAAVGINEIRQLKSFFARKSWGEQKRKIVLIPNGTDLSPEAQNALLKTLEELKKREFVFIGAKNAAGLLPTLVSRCQIIRSTEKLIISSSPFNFDSLKKEFWAKKTCLTDEEIKEKMEATLSDYQQKLLTAKNKEEFFSFKKKLSLCFKALLMMEANIKPLFVVDWLLLNL